MAPACHSKPFRNPQGPREPSRAFARPCQPVRIAASIRKSSPSPAKPWRALASCRSPSKPSQAFTCICRH
eukprot:3843588-Alexandrium_andersonii.AAC.1